MAIIGVVSGYDECEQLGGALKSLSPAVDRVVYVDGCYEDWPRRAGQEPWSTDGSVDMARSRGCQVIETPAPWRDQAAKRSAYLVGDMGDWYIQLDCDERLVVTGDPRRWLPGTTCLAWLLVQLQDPHGWRWMPRIWCHLEGLHYRGKHSDLWDGHGRKTALQDGDGTETPHRGGCCLLARILHLREQKPRVRRDQQGCYYSTRKER